MWFESAVAHHLLSLLARPDRLLPSHRYSIVRRLSRRFPYQHLWSCRRGAQSRSSLRTFAKHAEVAFRVRARQHPAPA